MTQNPIVNNAAYRVEQSHLNLAIFVQPFQAAGDEHGTKTNRREVGKLFGMIDAT
jgi:hypothetical protein